MTDRQCARPQHILRAGQLLEVAGAARSPPTKGSGTKPPPERCTLTAEKVTSSAFASLKGLSVNITFNVEPAVLGAVGEVGDEVLELLQPVNTCVRATKNTNLSDDLPNVDCERHDQRCAGSHVRGRRELSAAARF